MQIFPASIYTALLDTALLFSRGYFCTNGLQNPAFLGKSYIVNFARCVSQMTLKTQRIINVRGRIFFILRNMTSYVFIVSCWAMQHFFVVLFAQVIILEEYPCLFSALTFGQNIQYFWLVLFFPSLGGGFPIPVSCPLAEKAGDNYKEVLSPMKRENVKRLDRSQCQASE